MGAINRERVTQAVEAMLAQPTTATPEQRAKVRDAATWLLAQPDWYLDAATEHHGTPLMAMRGELRARLAGQMSPIAGRILRSHEQTALRVAAAMAR